MKTRQRGFTIIELMIAIAIIGVLAAIAIPAYQDYIKRARVSEGLTLATQVKDAATEYYMSNGTFPTSNAMCGLAPSTSITGNSVQSIRINSSGVIIITYFSTSDSTSYGVGTQQLSLNLSPTATLGSVKWNIVSGGANGVPQKWCPTTAQCYGIGY